jgi:hypothetical protein
MPATSPQPIPERAEFARIRDELSITYKPANAHEHMLVANIAHTWIRVQRAYDLEHRYAEANDLFEAIAAESEQFKLVARYVADCERAWRHAVEMLESSQRRRQRAEVPVPKRAAAPRPQLVTPDPDPAPRIAAPVGPIRPPHRE